MTAYIPEKFYIARCSRSADETLGFMVPITKTSAAQIKTADNWAYKSALPAIEWANELSTGYNLVTFSRRYSTSNVVWRLLHPLGFEVEITSENMMELLSCTTIINGAIQDKLQWVRDGRTNGIYPEGSPKLIAALTQTKVEASINLKDLKPGNLVITSDGTEQFYLGAYHVMSSASIFSNAPKIEKSKRVHIFCQIYEKALDEKILQASKSSMHGYGSVKVREIKDTCTLNEDILLNHIKRNIDKLYLYSGEEIIAIHNKPFNTNHLKPHKTITSSGALTARNRCIFAELKSGVVLGGCYRDIYNSSSLNGCHNGYPTVQQEIGGVTINALNQSISSYYIGDRRSFFETDAKEFFYYTFDVQTPLKG